MTGSVGCAYLTGSTDLTGSIGCTYLTGSFCLTGSIGCTCLTGSFCLTGSIGCALPIYVVRLEGRREGGWILPRLHDEEILLNLGVHGRTERSAVLADLAEKDLEYLLAVLAIR